MQVVPALIRLDAQKASLQAYCEDAKVQAARFDARGEVERSEHDLQAACELTFHKRNWDRMADLKTAVEFASAACERAATLCGPNVQGVQFEAMPEADVDHSAAKATGVADDIDDADDDEKLDSIVAPKARRGRWRHGDKASKRGKGLKV